MQLKASVFTAAGILAVADLAQATSIHRSKRAEKSKEFYFIKNAHSNNIIGVNGLGDGFSSNNMYMVDDELLNWSDHSSDQHLFEIEMQPDGKHVSIAAKDWEPKLYLTVPPTDGHRGGVPTFTTWYGYDDDDQIFELVPTGIADQYAITMKYDGEGGKLSLGWNEKNPNNGGFFAMPATKYDDMKWYIKKYVPPTTMKPAETVSFNLVSSMAPVIPDAKKADPSSVTEFATTESAIAQRSKTHGHETTLPDWLHTDEDGF